MVGTGWCQRCNAEVGIDSLKFSGTLVSWRCVACKQRYKCDIKEKTLKEVGVNLIGEEDQPPIDAPWGSDEILKCVEDINRVEVFLQYE